MSSTQPAGERQSLVDALRGFALLGILVVNIAAFASPYYGQPLPDPMMRTGLDRAAAFAVAFLFETKFYLLFSFLFGYSFTLQMQSAQRSGKPFVPRLARRLVALWLIGALHAVLLFHGDILTTYAVLGAVLLALRHQSDAVLARWALRLVLATALLWGAIGVLAMLGGPATEEVLRTAKTDAASALAAYRGTAATVVRQHLHELSQVWIVLGLVQAPMALAMFFAGVIEGRRNLFARAGRYRPLFKRLLVPGLVLGLPGAAVYAWTAAVVPGSRWDVLGLAVGVFTSPLLTATYVGAMMLLFQSRWGAWLASALAPAGRMALSNYLLQSAVCAWLFLAYGLRLIGEFGPFVSLMVAFGIFGAQLLFSRWWMARFAYGPVEWVLRAFTNLEWPALYRVRGSR
ncbi:DUF418 domain-containing protein [Acidovorax cavernicola]|uniref:DUF418 domain-containing protein n=1 Tax=Acidovorax cavernicola TaxID=1675792 RepID=A0A9X8D777_9BURK|nr:DUF418 domain-containing protein [Acidovorax cavernicola]RIX82834.1 DUF418 domain-containing protein [Acidovorax cavernicola]